MFHINVVDLIMGLGNALQNRPVRVLGFIAALHAVIYGVGFFFGIGGFGETVLYTALGPLSVIYGFATSLLLTGLLLCWAYARNNPKSIQFASGLCGTAWLFAALSYVFSGAWLLALGIGLPWAVLAYYLAFAHGNRRAIMAYDRTDQAREDTANEDQL